MTIGFIAFHYPHPSHRDEMIDRVEHAVAVINAQPGCLGAECWLTDTSDGEAVVSSARWESAAARDAAFAAARDAGADFRFDEREVRPRLIWDLTTPTRR